MLDDAFKKIHLGTVTFSSQNPAKSPLIGKIEKIKIFNFSYFFTDFYYSLCLDANNFVKFQTLWAYNFGTVRRKKSKISLKNPKFIRDSVKQIKKYGYRVKNRSYLRFCLAKSGFLDVNNEKCYFLTQQKTTITTTSIQIRPIY
jgi:hypothetical protein